MSNCATSPNLSDFCGMLAFDKWTCNTNGRQAVFFRPQAEASYRAQMPYGLQMIDQGFCFNAGEWNFPDAPLRGLYARHRVYESVRGMESFEPWLARIETKISEAGARGSRKRDSAGVVQFRSGRARADCWKISCGGASGCAN